MCSVSDAYGAIWDRKLSHNAINPTICHSIPFDINHWNLLLLFYSIFSRFTYTLIVVLEEIDSLLSHQACHHLLLLLLLLETGA